ncbi:hypothetical protein CHS0354_020810 [Potamilus streckersoni]|uniref:Ig-like domain-containing protein n=1 Tax=Potamilus streckersoni TaxID=2493646 RepID=A0AAE0S2G4_9BIVA|nr:hypothetical protein CHS0354_020810 [Potamilus streckersoni]
MSFFIFLTLLLTGLSGSTPIISLNGQSPAIYGNSLTLMCQADQDVGLGYVLFRRDGVSIIRITDTCAFSKESSSDTNVYSVVCNLPQRIFTMVKHNVTYNDHKTTWTCQMYSSSGTNGTCVGTANSCSSTSIIITIEGPPIVQLSPETSEYNVTEETKNFTLKCVVTQSVPLPAPNSFIWLYQGSVVQGQRWESYTIPVVQRSYGGSYQCIATNPYGNGTSKKLNLDVQYAPTIFLPENKEIEEGRNFWATCNVSANPKPVVVWTKSGVNVFVSANLTITSIKRHQKGNYSCTATNLLYPTGQPPMSMTTAKTLHVSVLYAPVVKIKPCCNAYPLIVKLGQKNVVLNCAVIEAYPEPSTFIWTHDGTELQSDRSSTYPITEVTRRTNGIWGCKGVNTYGTPIEDYMDIEVHYGPVVRVSGDITLYEGESLTVECTVDASPPAFEVFWSKDDDSAFYRNTTGLSFDRVSRHDSGTYRCTARNQIHPSGRNEELMNGTMFFHVNVRSEDASLLASVLGGTLAAIVVLTSVAITVFILKTKRCSHRHFILPVAMSKQKENAGSLSSTGPDPIYANATHNRAESSVEYDDLLVNRPKSSLYLQLTVVSADNIGNSNDSQTVGNAYDDLHLYTNYQVQTDITQCPEIQTEGEYQMYANLQTKT